MDPRQIFQQPQQPSTWFQNNLTGVYYDSGILRWFGSLKDASDKKRRQCKQYMEATATAFPILAAAQQDSLRTAAVAWGIPCKAIDKFSNPALIKLVCIISQMTEGLLQLVHPHTPKGSKSRINARQLKHYTQILESGRRFLQILAPHAKGFT